MTTKAQYIAQAKAANPQPQYHTSNGVATQLTEDEYELSIEAWADMRIEQDIAEAAAAQLRETKIAAYKKLGLSDEQIAALVG